MDGFFAHSFVNEDDIDGKMFVCLFVLCVGTDIALKIVVIFVYV